MPQTRSLAAQVRGNLIEDTAPLHGGIVADQALDLTIKALFELAGILGPADLVGLGLPSLQRGTARERGMRLVVVFGLHPSPETQIELLEGGHPFPIQALDQLGSERPPQSFNLAFRGSVTRP